MEIGTFDSPLDHKSIVYINNNIDKVDKNTKAKIGKFISDFNFVLNRLTAMKFRLEPIKGSKYNYSLIQEIEYKQYLVQLISKEYKVKLKHIDLLLSHVDKDLASHIRCYIIGKLRNEAEYYRDYDKYEKRKILIEKRQIENNQTKFQ